MSIRPRWVHSLAIMALCAVLPGACTLEVGEDEGSGLEASAQAILDGSAAAWNDGDLDSYVSMYADASTTSLVTEDGPVYGREQIRAWYAPAFGEGASRDSLRFEDLAVRQLPPLIGLATARYILDSEGEVTHTGWVTFVLRRVGSGWRVIHDHPSPSGTPE